MRIIANNFSSVPRNKFLFLVVSSMKEPVPGWIDNFNGPCGILVAYGKGIMRTLYCNDKMRPDYIPVDVTIKAMVVATWDTAIKRSSS